MLRTAFAVVLLPLLSACGSYDACKFCNKTADGGAVEKSNQGGDEDPCTGDAGIEAIDWQAKSDVGSPADLFGGAEGSCEADFTWDAAPFDDRRVEPLMGSTRVTVELTLDHDSARWHQKKARPGLAGPCGGDLAVDGEVSVATDDGTFRAHSKVTLQNYGRAQNYGFSQDVADSKGSLSIELHKGERGALAYTIDGSGVCAGEIKLMVASSSGGETMAGIGRLAQWSDSPCPLGQAPVDLTQPLAMDGPTLAKVIEDLWGKRTYSGTWQDGTKTDLELRVEVPGQTACRELMTDGAVMVPIRVTYSTSDKRLREHTADATVRATLGDGKINQLDFWLSDELVCADEKDELDYTPKDCAEVENVIVQLGFNYDGSGEPLVSEGGVNVYFTQRGGGDPPPRDQLTL